MCLTCTKLCLKMLKSKFSKKAGLANADNEKRKISVLDLGTCIDSIFQIPTQKVSLSIFHLPPPSSIIPFALTIQIILIKIATLQKILQSCETYQRLQVIPDVLSLPSQRYKVNSEIASYLMELDNTTVIHVVDLQTNFSSACFLAGELLKIVLHAFIKCCPSIYITANQI